MAYSLQTLQQPLIHSLPKPCFSRQCSLVHKQPLKPARTPLVFNCVHSPSMAQATGALCAPKPGPAGARPWPPSTRSWWISGTGQRMAASSPGKWDSRLTVGSGGCAPSMSLTTAGPPRPRTGVAGPAAPSAPGLRGASSHVSSPPPECLHTCDHIKAAHTHVQRHTAIQAAPWPMGLHASSAISKSAISKARQVGMHSLDKSVPDHHSNGHSCSRTSGPHVQV